MKLFLVLLVFVSAANSVPLKTQRDVTRRYFPEEEDPYYREFIYMEDESGVLHYVNLTAPYPTPRATTSDVTFYLYTRQNSSPFVIRADDISTLAQSPFNPSRNNLFISHGWNNHYQSSVNTRIRPAALQVADLNIFVVDWSGLANGLYTSARSVVPTIGAIEADFIKYLIDNYGLTTDDFILVGHSLGAHVAGCAGAALNGTVHSIVGLDPASPLYTLGNIDNRLDPTDGQVVHIIHTNGGLLGFSSSIGDADYFPNGGSRQPGCGVDLVGTCAHSRAHAYFAESIVSSGFFSLLCDSYSSFSNGRCRTNDQSVLGELQIDRSAYGDFYLDTAESSPYALGAV